MKAHACALLLLFCLPTLAAAENPAKQSADGYRKSLFNGENLDGWVVTNCRAEAQEGKLVALEGDGFIRTHHRYRDFVLELEWKPRKAAKFDSGIYFRCEPPTGKRPWPKRYQINLKQKDEGNLIGVKAAGSRQEVLKPGDWNRLRLTVIGARAELTINDQPVWKTDQIEAADGHIGIQVEEPLGGAFEFRKLFVTELNFKALFNGRDLSGWEGAGRDAKLCWKVEDGLLLCTGAKGPWLRLQKQVEDFNLRLEYRVRPGGNSGVYVRVPKNGNHHGKGAGVEIQILDDNAKRYKKLKPYQYCGSVYAIKAASPRVCRKPGEWNTLEIDCRGSKYRVVHNGVVVIQTDAKDSPKLAERLTAGFLGFQNHSEEVWFRHIRLGDSLQRRVGGPYRGGSRGHSPFRPTNANVSRRPNPPSPCQSPGAAIWLSLSRRRQARELDLPTTPIKSTARDLDFCRF